MNRPDIAFSGLYCRIMIRRVSSCKSIRNRKSHRGILMKSNDKIKNHGKFG